MKIHVSKKWSVRWVEDMGERRSVGKFKEVGGLWIRMSRKEDE